MCSAMHMLEILDAGIEAVVVLLGAKGVALLTRPVVAHVHGQVAGALHNICNQRVVESLARRNACILQVGVVPVVVLGRGHLRQRRQRRQRRTIEIRVGTGYPRERSVPRRAIHPFIDVEARVLIEEIDEVLRSGFIPGQRRIGQTVTAVAYISELEAHVRRQLLLHAEVERFAVAQTQRLWAYLYREGIHGGGIGGGRCLGQNAGVIASAAAVIPIETGCRVRSQLRREAVGNAAKVGDTHRVENQAVRGAHHHVGQELVSDAQRRPEIERILVLLEAVASSSGKDQRSG